MVGFGGGKFWSGRGGNVCGGVVRGSSSNRGEGSYRGRDRGGSQRGGPAGGSGIETEGGETAEQPQEGW